MKTCPDCFSVFDLAMLPKVETAIRQTATIPAGVQIDINCPRCRKLLSRKIDDVEIAADYKDDRAERQAAKVAAHDAKKSGEKKRARPSSK